VIAFIIFAPFGLYSAFIILAFAFWYKGTICAFLCDLQILYRKRNFLESHFGNIACGNAEGVNSRRRIEIDNALKILSVKMLVSIQTAAAHQHKCNAVCYQTPVTDLYIKVVQFLQEAVPCEAFELREIVLQIILNGVLCRFH